MKIGIGNWARPFASAWRVIVFTLIVCATGQAWAVTANVVWESDFGTTTKTGIDGRNYTLSLPDNSWLQQDGTIYIQKYDHNKIYFYHTHQQ